MLTLAGVVALGQSEKYPPHIQACEDDKTVPGSPTEFTIDPINDEDAEHDYESPAFLRRAK